MQKRLLVAFVGVALLSGCAVVPSPGPTITVSTPFNPTEAAWSTKDGNNTITGSALMRTVGGDVKTCGGFTVFLQPVTTYSSEIMSKLFGSTEGGFARRPANVETPDGYDALLRTTTCDAQGKFTFSKLPDGEYFVATKVTWGAVQGGQYSYISQQGGVVMQKVRVAGGQTREIVLTP